MIRKIGLFVFFAGMLLATTNLSAQNKSIWTTLGKVTFKKQYDEMLGCKVDVPVFAGPETVMEVYSKDSIKYTAEAIIIRGKLELNDSDVNRLMYILNNAEMVRVAE